MLFDLSVEGFQTKEDVVRGNFVSHNCTLTSLWWLNGTNYQRRAITFKCNRLDTIVCIFKANNVAGSFGAVIVDKNLATWSECAFTGLLLRFVSKLVCLAGIELELFFLVNKTDFFDISRKGR